MKETPFLYIVVLTSFLANTFGPMPLVQAQEFHLPAPGVRVELSPDFNPPMLKGIKVHPDNPFQFDFILDQGDDYLNTGLKQSQQEQVKQEAVKLIKYFLASLTIPEQDLWVNLSPYEKDRIIPQSFGQTEMGRDLLAEDYMLKQITASLIYPEGKIGKKFWKRIYEDAQKKYGTTDIPVNTFNKVWIIPEKAVVYENAKAGTAYVVESKLKVMLEQDYLALEKNRRQTPQVNNGSTSEGISAIGSNIIREIVIPELTKEVNEDKNFSQLRQVYNSLILATWYKKKIKDSILEQVYADKNKIAGVGYKNIPADDIEGIYQRYLQAFKKGVFNYIKEEPGPGMKDIIPRKYFSGGVSLFDLAMKANSIMQYTNAAPQSLDHALDVKVNMAMSNSGNRHTDRSSPRPGTNQAMKVDVDQQLIAIQELFDTLKAKAEKEGKVKSNADIMRELNRLIEVEEKAGTTRVGGVFINAWVKLDASDFDEHGKLIPVRLDEHWEMLPNRLRDEIVNKITAMTNEFNQSSVNNILNFKERPDILTVRNLLEHGLTEEDILKVAEGGGYGEIRKNVQTLDVDVTHLTQFLFNVGERILSLHGTDHLYFAARDAKLLYDTVQLMADRSGQAVDMHLQLDNDDLRKTIGAWSKREKIVYLDHLGITKEAVEDPVPFVFIDTGFRGSYAEFMFGLIEDAYPEVFAQRGPVFKKNKLQWQMVSTTGNPAENEIPWSFDLGPSLSLTDYQSMFPWSLKGRTQERFNMFIQRRGDLAAEHLVMANVLQMMPKFSPKAKGIKITTRGVEYIPGQARIDPLPEFAFDANQDIVNPALSFIIQYRLTKQILELMPADLAMKTMLESDHAMAPMRELREFISESRKIWERADSSVEGVINDDAKRQAALEQNRSNLADKGDFYGLTAFLDHSPVMVGYVNSIQDMVAQVLGDSENLANERRRVATLKAGDNDVLVTPHALYTNSRTYHSTLVSNVLKTWSEVQGAKEELFEDTEGLKAMSLTPAGPHLMGDFGVIIQMETDDPQVMTIKDRFIIGSQKRNPQAKLPPFIHVSVAYIHNASAEQLRKINELFVQLRQKSFTWKVNIQELTITRGTIGRKTVKDKGPFVNLDRKINKQGEILQAPFNADQFKELFGHLSQVLSDRGISFRRAINGISSDTSIEPDYSRSMALVKSGASAAQYETMTLWSINQGRGVMFGYGDEQGHWLGYGFFTPRTHDSFNVRFQIFDELRSQGKGEQMFSFLRTVLVDLYQARQMVFPLVDDYEKEENSPTRRGLQALGFRQGERTDRLVYEIPSGKKRHYAMLSPEQKLVLIGQMAERLNAFEFTQYEMRVSGIHFEMGKADLIDIASTASVHDFIPRLPELLNILKAFLASTDLAVNVNDITDIFNEAVQMLPRGDKDRFTADARLHLWELVYKITEDLESENISWKDFFTYRTAAISSSNEKSDIIRAVLQHVLGRKIETLSRDQDFAVNLRVESRLLSAEWREKLKNDKKEKERRAMIYMVDMLRRDDNFLDIFSDEMLDQIKMKRRVDLKKMTDQVMDKGADLLVELLDINPLFLPEYLNNTMPFKLELYDRIYRMQTAAIEPSKEKPFFWAENDEKKLFLRDGDKINIKVYVRHKDGRLSLSSIENEQEIPPMDLSKKIPIGPFTIRVIGDQDGFKIVNEGKDYMRVVFSSAMLPQERVQALVKEFGEQAFKNKIKYSWLAAFARSWKIRELFVHTLVPMGTQFNHQDESIYTLFEPLEKEIRPAPAKQDWTLDQHHAYWDVFEQTMDYVEQKEIANDIYLKIKGATIIPDKDKAGDFNRFVGSYGNEMGDDIHLGLIHYFVHGSTIGHETSWNGGFDLDKEKGFRSKVFSMVSEMLANPGNQAMSTFKPEGAIKKVYDSKKDIFKKGWWVAFDLDKAGDIESTLRQRAIGDLNQIILKTFNHPDAEFFATGRTSDAYQFEEGFIYIPDGISQDELKAQMDAVRDSLPQETLRDIRSRETVTLAAVNGNDLSAYIASHATGPSPEKDLYAMEGLLNQLLGNGKGTKGRLRGAGYGNKSLFYDRAKEAVEDQSAKPAESGGIDLTSANMNLQSQNNGGMIKFHLDPAMLAQLKNAPGFVPFIISVKPLRDLRGFLGVQNDNVSSASAPL